MIRLLALRNGESVLAHTYGWCHCKMGDSSEYCGTSCQLFSLSREANGVADIFFACCGHSDTYPIVEEEEDEQSNKNGA